MPDSIGIPIFVGLIVLIILVNIKPKQPQAKCVRCKKTWEKSCFPANPENDSARRNVCKFCLTNARRAEEQRAKVARMDKVERARHVRTEIYAFSVIITGGLGFIHPSWWLATGYSALVLFVVASTKGGREGKPWTIGDRLEYALILPLILFVILAIALGMEGGGR